MTPEPTSLFKEGKIRKNVKSILRNHILKTAPSIKEAPNTNVAIIDGGDLLFKTTWDQTNTYKEISQKYVDYITVNFKENHVCIVFDGYSHEDSTKGEEHMLRGKGVSSANVSSANVLIKNLESKPTCNKMAFLKNRNNKMQLIQVLKTQFQKAGLQVMQSKGDADVMMCKAALDYAREGFSVQLSGKDTD